MIIRSQRTNKGNWKTLTMIFMTLGLSVDLTFLISLLEEYILGYRIFQLNINVGFERMNDLVEFIICIVLPILVLNYLLVFKNDKYELLINRYPNYGGKLFITFFILSMFLPVISIYGILLFS